MNLFTEFELLDTTITRLCRTALAAGRGLRVWIAGCGEGVAAFIVFLAGTLNAAFNSGRFIQNNIIHHKPVLPAEYPAVATPGVHPERFFRSE